jgi:hypothetical protein
MPRLGVFRWLRLGGYRATPDEFELAEERLAAADAKADAAVAVAAARREVWWPEREARCG